MRTLPDNPIRVIIIAMIITTISPFFLLGQGTFKNGGTYTNNGTMTVNTYQNWKPGNPGTTNNNGTINADNAMDNNLASAVINNNAGGAINVTGATSDYNNGAGATNNSTGTSKVQVVNTLTLGAGAFTTTSGEVEYASGGAQTIQSGVASATYGKLSIAGGAGTKSPNGNIVVGDTVRLGTGTTFDVAGNQLTLNGAVPFDGGGTFSASTASSTVIYNATGSQQVRGASYYNLTLQNTGTKTAQGGVTIVGSGTLTNSDEFSMGTNTLTASAAGITLTNTGATIRSAGNVDFGTNNFTIAGTFIYEAGSGSQNIGSASYSNLTLQGAGNKVYPANTVSVTGTYSVAGGGRNYIANGGTFSYAGTAAQTVLSGESYNNLTVTGTADTSVYKTANGSLSIAGALSIGANSTLDMAANPFSTLGSGTLNATGKIRWSAGNSHVISGGGTTEFYSSSAATVLAGTYGNLWFNGSGTKSIAGVIVATGGNSATFGVTVSDNLTINGGGSLTVTGMDLNNDGTLTNGGTITLN